MRKSPVIKCLRFSSQSLLHVPRAKTDFGRLAFVLSPLLLPKSGTIYLPPLKSHHHLIPSNVTSKHTILHLYNFLTTNSDCLAPLIYLRNRRWGGCVYVLQMFFCFFFVFCFCLFFAFSVHHKNTRQPFWGTAERNRFSWNFYQTIAGKIEFASPYPNGV